MPTAKRQQGALAEAKKYFPNSANERSVGGLFLMRTQREYDGMVEPAFDRRNQVQDSAGATRTDDLALLADEELLRRYRDARGADAFTAMVRRHQPMVLRTCLRLVRNQHDAEDAAQSVFLVLAERPEVVSRSLAGWLHGLARAAVSELCRSRRRRTEREEMAARMKSMFTRLRGGSQHMEGQELGEELDAALTQLPDQLQQAVILRYLEGHSQQEAANRAGCTQVTMGWRSMKGLERLRTILGRRGVVLTSAALLAVLAAEARATAALGLTGAATGPATATAVRVAAVLVNRSLLAVTLRRGAVFGLLLAAGLGLGIGFGLKRPDKAEPPANPPLAGAQVPDGAAPALGLFDRSLDIGGPKRAGEAKFEGGVYTIRGGGEAIYFKEDQFHFVCKPWTGDGEIIARVESDPKQEAGQVAAGVMFRESLKADSPHVSNLIGANGQYDFKYRKTANDSSGCDNTPGDTPGKYWVRLVREGNKFTASVRRDGKDTWELPKELQLPMKSSLYVGLAVTAHDDAQLAAASFDRVSLRVVPERK